MKLGTKPVKALKGKPVFLGTLGGKRVGITVDDCKKVTVPEGMSPKAYLAKHGYKLVVRPRKTAASRQYEKMWRAEHPGKAAKRK